MNGQQRRPSIPTVLVLVGVALTTTATITRAVATTALFPTAMATLGFVHFYL
jgi:hypothetical protein